MKIKVAADLPLDARTYLLERDGAAFRSFIAEEMSLQEYEITECWKEGRATVIRLNSKPNVAAWIPGPLAAKIPEKFEYFDEASVTYDPASLVEPPYVLPIRSFAPFLGDKGRFVSRTTIEPLGPERCRHVLEQTIEFKGLWGLGKVASKLAKSSMEKSFADMPELIQKWVGIRQDLLQTRHGRERLLAGRPRVEGVAWMDEHVAALKHGKKHRRSAKPQLRLTSSQSVLIEAKAGPEAGGEAANEAQLGQPPRSAFAAAEVQRVAVGEPAAEERVVASMSAAADGSATDEGMYVEAEERAMRQSTAGTAFFTPSASPAPSGAAQLATGPTAETALPAGAAAAAVAEAALPVPALRQPRVMVQRVDAEGRPRQQADASEGGGSPFAAPASVGYSGSAEQSSEESSDEDSEQEAWTTAARWRAYYHERGLQPLRRDHSLPAPLVRKFIPKRRPQPVSAHRLDGPHQQQPGGGKRGRWSWVGEVFGRMCGTGVTATAAQ